MTRFKHIHTYLDDIELISIVPEYKYNTFKFDFDDDEEQEIDWESTEGFPMGNGTSLK
jgi:hypothetical protein